MGLRGGDESESKTSFLAPPSLVYRAGVAIVIGIAFIGTGLAEGSPFQLAAGAVLALHGVRTLFVKVVVDDNYLVIRNMYWTHRIAWQDIRSIDMIAKPFRFVAAGLGLIHYRLCVVLRNGHTIPVHGTQRIGGGGLYSDVDEPADVIRAAWHKATAV